MLLDVVTVFDGNDNEYDDGRCGPTNPLDFRCRLVSMLSGSVSVVLLLLFVVLIADDDGGRCGPTIRL
jgi:hypothetical protein